MKYLTTGRTGRVPIPPEMGVALYQATTAWVNAKLADGTIDCHYVFADLSGGFAIGNADSHEEMMGNLLSYPLYPFFDWETIPLADWSHSYEKLIEYFQQLPK